VAGLPERFAGNAASVVVAKGIPGTASRGDIAACLQRELEPMQAKPSAELEATARLTAEVAHHRLPFTVFSISKMLGRRPSLLYTNSFQKFPIYDLDFGHGARPVRAVPHNLGDPILLWPAPPTAGGIEVYFSGALARAVRALPDTDPWWAELGRYEAEAKTGEAF
jgi:hypothetical protein